MCWSPPECSVSFFQIWISLRPDFSDCCGLPGALPSMKNLCPPSVLPASPECIWPLGGSGSCLTCYPHPCFLWLAFFVPYLFIILPLQPDCNHLAFLERQTILLFFLILMPYAEQDQGICTGGTWGLFLTFLRTLSLKEGKCLMLLFSQPGSLLDDLCLTDHQKHKLVDCLSYCWHISISV